MDILGRVFGSHAQNLNQALDRTSKRHSLLAGNLANVNTPGYKRRDLDFGIELQQAEGRIGIERIQRLRDRLEGPQVSTGDVRVDGNSVDMEAEVAAIAETELRYQVLSEMTQRFFSGLRNVIREGR